MRLVFAFHTAWYYQWFLTGTLQVLINSLVQVHRNKKLSIVALAYPFRTKPSRPRSPILELCFAPLLDRFGSVSTPIRNFLILVHCRPPSRGVDNFRPQYQVAPNSRIIISTWIQNLFFIVSYTWVLSKSIAICFSVRDAISIGVSGIFAVNFWNPSLPCAYQLGHTDPY